MTTGALHTLDTAWCQDWPSLLLYVRYSSTPSACLHGAALCPACQLTRASAPILAQTRPRRAKLPRTRWGRWSGFIGGHLGHVPLTFFELGVRALSRPASKTRDSNTEFTSEMQHSADGGAGRGIRARLPTAMWAVSAAPFYHIGRRCLSAPSCLSRSSSAER